MSILADRLDALVVRATSPDGGITAELSHRTQTRVTFQPGAYRGYDERSISGQLVGVAKLLWAERTRGYYAALSEAFDEVITHEAPAVSPRDVAYRQDRDELVARGESSDGRIVLTVRGMRAWSAHVADGTLRALGEDAFAVRLGEAAEALIHDQSEKTVRLKRLHYGGGTVS